jgi:hypothetical protein
VQVARGSVRLGDLALQQGDGAALEGEDAVRLRAGAEAAQVLVFDLG